MTYTDIGNLIIRVGVEPAIIAALLYLVYKLVTDHQKSITDLSCALADNTTALEKLVEYTRGRNNG
jgi:hypothetical protein